MLKQLEQRTGIRRAPGNGEAGFFDDMNQTFTQELIAVAHTTAAGTFGRGVLLSLHRSADYTSFAQ